MQSRRKTLKQFAGAAALAASGCRPRESVTKLKEYDPNAVYDCIVLGAGVAGLTAAWQLQQWWGDRGKVLVLEGSDRLGGRIQTLHDRGSIPWELGAEFVHRSPGTVPLWKYIDHFHLQTSTIPKMNASRIFYPGRPAFAGGRRPATAAVLWNAFRAANMFGRINSHIGDDLSASTWARQYATILGWDQGLGQDFVMMALTGHMPATPDRLSIKGFARDTISVQLEEENEYYLTAGYDSLVHSLSQGVEILLSKPIEKVTYKDDGVEVFAAGQSFRARSAICTFSVGMLRDGGVRFSPILPMEKRDALLSLDCGYHSKVIIPFKIQFWPPEMSMAHFPTHERRAGKTYFNLSYGDPLRPPTLTHLYMGVDALRLDALPLEQALFEICADLDKMFPAHAPTFRYLDRDSAGTVRALRKVWKDDPFAKGGNSYVCLGGTPLVPNVEARKELADPRLTPNLFWAGEATALTTQPASVHGANESGLRAASEVWRKFHR